MKTIDKLIIIAMGLILVLGNEWETGLPLVGSCSLLYAVGYLVLLAMEEDY